jgi:hypothetical protein
MSQDGGHKVGMRAILAIVGVCALVLGLLAAAPHASAGAGLRGAAQGAGAFCHQRVAPLPASDHSTPAENGDEKHIACPCCLSAHASPVVLPERVALLMRLDPAAIPAVYCSFPKSLPHFTLRLSVNCARAPPAVAPLA